MVRSSAKESPEIEINVHSTPPQGHPPSYDPDSPQSEEWNPWFVPLVFIINVALFIMSMYINNCPSHSRSCIGVQSLQRFAFENIHENPLLGPATATYVLFLQLVNLECLILQKRFMAPTYNELSSNCYCLS